MSSPGLSGGVTKWCWPDEEISRTSPALDFKANQAIHRHLHFFPGGHRGIQPPNEGDSPEKKLSGFVTVQARGQRRKYRIYFGNTRETRLQFAMVAGQRSIIEGEDGIQSIIDHPSAEPSGETLKTLLLNISSQTPSTRAKAFSALAITFQYHQAKASLLFQVPLESLLHSTIVQEVCDGLSGLSAIFMLSPQDAIGIIRSDGFLSRLAESVVDLLALGPSKKKSKADLNHSFSEFIALSLNHKPVREIIKSDWPGCLDWLTRISLATTNNVSISARCAASLALIKLRLTSDLQDKSIELPSLTHLTGIMLNALLDKTCPSNSPIEGLALLSQQGSVRQILMKESERFLRATKALSTSKETLNADGISKSDTSIAYGIATIIAHLSAYKVIKTDEDRAADQLKKLAQRGGQTASNDKLPGSSVDDQDTEIDDELVYEWIHSSLKRNNDLMDTVGWLAKSESKEVKRTTGKAILNLVERQACRGLVLQSGGGRMLMKIIATLTVSDNRSKQQLPSSSSESGQSTNPDSSDPTLDPSDLHIIQALAKILITTNPLLIFGPSPDSPILHSTIKPLTTLFVHPSSTLLQTFEALMALTNLSSLGGRIPDDIVGSTRVLNRLEECTIGVRTGENHMVRRAATELICNLSSTQIVLNSFGPQTNEPVGSRGSSHISRLHILIALCSSEDLQTALAAGGALAILTEHSKEICQAILTEEKLKASLVRIFRESIEEEEEEKEGEDGGGEGEGEEGRIGIQFRLISLIGNLSTARETNPEFFNHSLIQSLNSLISKLANQDKNKSQAEDLTQLTKLVIQSIEK
ncbi:hypothetical protein MJO28_008192 [Puccinia striiformis f. sp. tritici]|uniref:Uncharacterized protein n=1 Tax=Puccinia striiformis f. sp. tritici TaxID=168172 RepID=A0ACC0EBZ1_9BASI|nr:hypothetical protein MJO28_008192 [Puccinia striiformis f. sp. tritici]